MSMSSMIFRLIAEDNASPAAQRLAEQMKGLALAAETLEKKFSDVRREQKKLTKDMTEHEKTMAALGRKRAKDNAMALRSLETRRKAEDRLRKEAERAARKTAEAWEKSNKRKIKAAKSTANAVLHLSGIGIAAISRLGKKFVSLSAEITEFSIRIGSDLQLAMAHVERISGNTGRNLEAMTDAVIEMSKELGIAAPELGNLASEVSRLGVDSREDIIKMTNTLARGATLWKASMQTMVDEVGKLAVIYSEKLGGSVSDTTDKMVAMITKGASMAAVTEKGLVGALIRAQAPMNQLNIPVEKQIALAAALSERMESTSVAGTALRITFERLSTRAGEFEKQLGINKERFLELINSNPAAALQELEQAIFRNRGRAQGLSAAFNVLRERGTKGLLNVGAAAEKTEKIFEQLKLTGENASGFIEDQWTIVAETITIKWNKAQQQLSAVGIKIFKVIEPVAERVIGKISGMFERIEKFVESEDGKKAILELAEGFEKISDVVTGALPGIIKNLGDEIVKLGETGALEKSFTSLKEWVQGVAGSVNVLVNNIQSLIAIGEGVKKMAKGNVFEGTLQAGAGIKDFFREDGEVGQSGIIGKALDLNKRVDEMLEIGYSSFAKRYGDELAGKVLSIGVRQDRDFFLKANKGGTGLSSGGFLAGVGGIQFGSDRKRDHEDTIPARLSPGEFVMTRRSTSVIGPKNLGMLMKAAEGGSSAEVDKWIAEVLARAVSRGRLNRVGLGGSISQSLPNRLKWESGNVLDPVTGASGGALNTMLREWFLGRGQRAPQQGVPGSGIGFSGGAAGGVAGMGGAGVSSSGGAGMGPRSGRMGSASGGTSAEDVFNQTMNNLLSKDKKASATPRSAKSLAIIMNRLRKSSNPLQFAQGFDAAWQTAAAMGKTRELQELVSGVINRYGRSLGDAYEQSFEMRQGELRGGLPRGTHRLPDANRDAAVAALLSGDPQHIANAIATAEGMKNQFFMATNPRMKHKMERYISAMVAALRMMGPSAKGIVGRVEANTSLGERMGRYMREDNHLVSEDVMLGLARGKPGHSNEESLAKIRAESEERKRKQREKEEKLMSDYRQKFGMSKRDKEKAFEQAGFAGLMSDRNAGNTVSNEGSAGWNFGQRKDRTKKQIEETAKNLEKHMWGRNLHTIIGPNGKTIQLTKDKYRAIATDAYTFAKQSMVGHHEPNQSDIDRLIWEMALKDRHGGGHFRTFAVGGMSMNTGLAVLHKGEMVLTKNEVDKIASRSGAGSGSPGGGGGGGSAAGGGPDGTPLSINFSGPVFGDRIILDRFVREEFMPSIARALRDEGLRLGTPIPGLGI